jgi:putative two-component system response regulator
MSEKPFILIVDDLERNRNLLQQYVNDLGYLTALANNGLEALDLINEVMPDLILLDMKMPIMDGYETLDQLKSDLKLRHIPVIMISAYGEMENVIPCIKRGAIDYLAKPFEPILLEARIESALSLKNLLDHEEEYRKKIENYSIQLESETLKRTSELSQTQLRLIHRLGRASEYKDNETGMHVVRISHYCSKLGEAFGWAKESCELIYNASPLHDVGKIGIPEHILLKPEKLNHDEWAIMKTHTTIGAEILKGGGSELETMAKKIALTHHEKWDGTGYPQGLKGEDIPIEGRIVAIADVFDSLTSERPFKQKWPIEDAVDFIENTSGTEFDPEMVKNFLKILPQIIEIKSEYPD